MIEKDRYCIKISKSSKYLFNLHLFYFLYCLLISFFLLLFDCNAENLFRKYYRILTSLANLICHLRYSLKFLFEYF